MPENVASQLHDIRGPQPVSGNSGGVYVVVIIAALVVMVIVWVVIKKLRRASDVNQRVSPEEEAQKQLQALGQRKADESFYISLSQITRQYIQDKLQIDALDMTTEELQSHLRTAAIMEVLQQCDLVKFSRRLPAEDQSRSLINTVQTFVQETSQKPQTL